MKKPELICLLCLLQYTSAEIYAIRFDSQFYFEEFEDAPATFGRKLSDGVIRGILVNADPPDGCTSALQPPPPDVENETGKWVVLMPRYNDVRNCSFEQKVRTGQAAGYDAVVVHNVHSNQLVPMSAKNDTGIYIPSVFVSESSGLMLKKIYADPKYFIVITGESPFNIQTHLLIPFAIVVGICFIVMIIFLVVKCIKDRRRQRRHRLPTSTLNKIPICKYQKGDPYETCAICLDDYIEGEKLRVLPCNHVYHTKCIDPWLTKNRRVCPICKRKVFAHDEPQHDSDSDTDADDTTPLINSSNRGTQGGTFQEQSENPIQRAVRSISQQSGAVNFVTASDHHSINGDYQSCNTSTTESEDCNLTSGTERMCDTLDEVHVHTQPDASSNEGSTDVHV
ncbi:hypothetical protein MTP99_010203 [Tenebrio molitor]|jgi:E3 ubiquitin-protein ligase RNF13|uniref:E3 ubiquitin-protein ligase RNF13-like n=1 Tax=Tenebrio molitor TaxID=7067 RepID=UPI001C3BFE75|nr:hypothetical protein MTP99_010203 [Tenebrio molitor]CAH1368715.1 unnamed protein product [Tenebrio molitor]